MYNVNMKILIVDNEETFADNFQYILERKISQEIKSNHEILVCHDGKKALLILENQKIDLLITDQEMPELDGTQLIKMAKQKYPDIRAYMVTGLFEEQINEKIYDRYFSKPTPFKQLISTIEMDFSEKKISA